MTLLGSILKRVQSQECFNRKYPSPPPETELDEISRVKYRRKKYKYRHVGAKVDCSPPRYDAHRMLNKLQAWSSNYRRICDDNIALLLAIKNMHYTRGRVDSHWKDKELPLPSKMYYENRMHFYKYVARENKTIYKRIMAARPRVETTASLRRDWARNRADILLRAQAKFVLFPPIPTEDIEDPAFLPPEGFKRPRVYLTLRIVNYAEFGALCVELFTDVCPRTCRLFLDLLAGDGLGYGYVGTQFFRKVPKLFWSGGDVIYNNGFGCYAQRGRVVPIGAENYHFSHSMPGLLSMRMTSNDEMCGEFNITFKPLPQFDLKGVVFGRVVRPCAVFTSILDMGAPLTKRPVVEISAARYKLHNRWVWGKPNANLKDLQLTRRRKMQSEIKSF